MQSGKAKTNLWVLEFDQETPRTIDPIMGYTSSADTRQQVKLTFETAEQAVAYAERNGIEYRVIAPKESTRKSGGGKSDAPPAGDAPGEPAPERCSRKKG